MSIRVDSPAPHAVITEQHVVVRGTVAIASGTEFAVTVNNFPALVHDRTFAAVVPIPGFAEPPTALIVVAADETGHSLVQDSIPVTVHLANSAPDVELRASEYVGIAPLAVTFHGWSAAPVEVATFDSRGDGRVDYRGPTLDVPAMTYQAPGIYLPALTVNGTHRAVAILRVYAKKDLDALLQEKWSGMRGALRRGDVDGAVRFFAIEQRETYRKTFNALTIPVADMGRLLGEITFQKIAGLRAEYEMVVDEGGQRRSELVVFVLDRDGIWRLKFV
ncbi:MAG TPA: hypothetical protein VKU61_04670 [Candidatus Binatia bacterium]|nr:hypothetical protein [Candidatus Binatia bacterium]